MTTSRHAVTSTPLHPLLATRHSTRAFAADASVTKTQALALMEAARWAPSCGNTQPTRFIVGRKESPTFGRILATLAPGNHGWAQYASMLVVSVATLENKKGPLPYAEYDAGQAMSHLVVQAMAEGLTVRQMAGFDKEMVSKEFDLAATQKPLSCAAIGVAGDPAALPDDLRGPDDSPRDRLPLDELILAD